MNTQPPTYQAQTGYGGYATQQPNPPQGAGQSQPGYQVFKLKVMDFTTLSKLNPTLPTLFLVKKQTRSDNFLLRLRYFRSYK